jgi:hypothetical protein
MVLNNYNIDLFPCYSFNLRDFLKSKGIKYKLTGLHPETKMKFFVYIETEEFKKAINEWRETKLN